MMLSREREEVFESGKVEGFEESIKEKVFNS